MNVRRFGALPVDTEPETSGDALRRPTPPTLLITLAALLGACASPTASRSVGRPLAAGEALETFDAAWEAVHETHFDPTFNGVDWDAVGAELRPRAEEAQTLDELRGVVRDMLGRLGQSHFVLLPAEALDRRDDGGGGSGSTASATRPDAPDAAEPDADVGLDVRLRDGELIVSDVVEGGPGALAGVRPGWILRAIGDYDLAQALTRLEEAEGVDPREVANGMRGRARSRLKGELGTSVTLRLEDGSGQEHELELGRTRPDAVREDFGGSLPAMDLVFESEEIASDGVRVGLLHFTNWFLPMVAPLDQAIDRFRPLDGIVIDVRGNGGGAAPMVMGLAGHFVDERVDLGIMHTRNGPLKFFANPRRVDTQGRPTRPFAGPLAVLIDETTGSASEVFAGGVQSIGRARVFGETSAGAVLPARTTFLPNGDALLHAMGDFVTADGTLLEGRGVVPDEPVPLRRADLLAGHDPQLDAAIAWIASETTSQP